MTSPNNHSKLLKFILSGLLIVGLWVAFTYWPSEKEALVVVSNKIDVPHSFTTEATGLIQEEGRATEQNVSRLNKYDIAKALAPVFECSELELEQNLSLIIGDMVIPLSAYDPQLKIGFIWLDYNLFGEGIIDKSYTEYISQKKAEQLFLSKVEEGIELYFEDEERFILDIFGKDPAEEPEDFADSEESLEEVEVIPANGAAGFSIPPPPPPPPPPFENVQRVESDQEIENVLIEELAGFTDVANVKLEDKKAFFDFVRLQRRNSPRIFRDMAINVTRGKWIFFKEAYSDKEMLYGLGQEIKMGMSDLQVYQDRREYLEIILVEFKKMIFLNEMNSKKHKTFIDDWVFSAAEMIDDPVRFFGFVERVKNLVFPSDSNPLTQAMENEVFKITLESDKEKWWKHSEAVINLLQSNKIAVINSRWEYDVLLSEIINNNPHQKWQEHYHKIADLGNKHTISKRELEALPGLSATHGISIASLSILDDRTIYDMKEQEHQDKLAALRKIINTTKDKSLRKTYKDDLMNLSQDRSQNYGEIRDDAKAKSTEKIVADMEFFLDWAKEIAADWKVNKGA